MNKQIENLKRTRAFVLDAIKEINVDQWNKVPNGFNNNIAWNIGHMCATMQGICYSRAGLLPIIDEKWILPYKSGTKPEKELSTEEVEELKLLFLSVVEALENDYNNQKFINYNSWTNRYKIELTTFEEALDFMLYHEGLHFGAIMALKKLV